MESANFSIIHFNSEDVIATSACTSDHSIFSYFLGEVTGVSSDTVDFDAYYDCGMSGDTPHDGIYTFYNEDCVVREAFRFTPEVGKTFYALVDEDELCYFYECNGTHDPGTLVKNNQ